MNFHAALFAAALCSFALSTHAAEQKACRYVKVGDLPLRMSGNNVQPLVEGSVNGMPATMLLDTGAYASMLTSEAVDKFNLNQRSTGTHAEGIGGISRLFSVRLNEFGIGPVRSRALTMNVIGDMGGKPGFDAILGADFLFQADIEIALADRAVRFFRPLDCNDDSFLAYWAKEAVVVPLTGAVGNSKNNYITVELNGVPFDAIIDTGSSRTVVFERAARKAGVLGDHPSSRQAGTLVGIGSDRQAARSAVFTTFAIGAEKIHDAELTILPDAGAPGSQIDILLGADFLRSHRILFAMSQRQLYLTYLGGDIFKPIRRAAPAPRTDGG